ncbi:MAG: bifunctional fructose-bisphosphatase/inositol-phosphate phosphatase [archaeon]|nr:bifunctional fructose-bisphosphatase/inositol-phosphate phosphatase [archaeon]
MNDWLKFLISTSREVHSAIKPILGSTLASEVIGKGAGGDFTMKIDKLAEDVIINSLKSQNISCIVVSEESGIMEIGGKPDVYIVIDSIDGTTNAIRGVPFFCTSIAMSKGNSIKYVDTGVVLNLSDGTIFYAERGKGAYMNDKKIKTSDRISLEDAVIGIDFSKAEENIITRLMPLFKKVRHMRHFGANALEICYVASGFTDAFVDVRGMLRVTDMAASYIILKEAGGEILTPNGKELDSILEPTQRVSFIAASNSIICDKILKTIDLGR